MVKKSKKGVIWKIKLRYLMSLFAIVMFLTGYGVELIYQQINGPCGGFTIICTPIGAILILLSTFTGYEVAMILTEPIVYSGQDGGIFFDLIFWILVVIINLLAYYILGFLIEKIALAIQRSRVI